jgi:hypothetical protein
VNRLEKGKAELAEMKSLRSLAEFTLLDSKRNREIRGQINICNNNEEIKTREELVQMYTQIFKNG